MKVLVIILFGLIFVAPFALMVLVILSVEGQLEAARKAQQERWAWLDKEQ